MGRGDAALEAAGWWACTEAGKDEEPWARQDHCMGEDMVCSSQTSESHWPAPNPPNRMTSWRATAHAAWAYREQGTTGGK